MWRYALQNHQPRGGQIKYIQAESGYEMKAYSLPELKGKIIAHRKNMNYPVGSNFNAEVEDQVCRNLDDDQREFFCRPQHELHSPAEIQSRLIMSGEFMSFGKMVADWVSQGVPMVDQATAELRASQCAGCVYNKKQGDCSTCRSAVRVIKGIAGKHTSRDNELHGCQICGCENSAAIWLDKEVQLKYLSEEVKNSFPNCWKHPGVE